MRPTDQDVRFFETFGFLRLPGALRAEIDWITEEFEAVFADRGVAHDGTKRSCVVPFIDQRERLCTLLDTPVVLAVGNRLLGEDFSYAAGDGNYYTGDTGWHSDGYHPDGGYLKVAIYLDPVGPDSGCLRVIPGSHRPACADWAARLAARSEELWSIPPRDVPAVPLPSEPGDVLVFDHNLMHSSWGGGSSRRMFTLNLVRRAQTPTQIQELEAYIADHDRFQVDSLHSDLMRQTGPVSRQRHLQQITEHEGHLAGLAAALRARGLEPARG